MTATTNELVQQVLDFLPELPEELTEEQSTNAVLNKLEFLHELIPGLQMAIHKGTIDALEAPAILAVAAIQLASFKGKTLDELLSYAVERYSEYEG